MPVVTRHGGTDNDEEQTVIKISHRQDVIEDQIKAMDVAKFDVAGRKQSGSHSVREGLFLSQLWGLVDLLREQNGKLGYEILIRPHGEHGMSLIGGLNRTALGTLRAKGYDPAIVVQYGPDHFQAWLRHDRKLDRHACERVTLHLAETFGGDVAHAHWDSFGYLANFLVPAWVLGAEQEVELLESNGLVYREAKPFLDRFLAPAT